MKQVMKSALKVAFWMLRIMYLVVSMIFIWAGCGHLYKHAKVVAGLYEEYGREEKAEPGKHAAWVKKHMHTIDNGAQYYYDEALDGWKWIIS